MTSIPDNIMVNNYYHPIVDSKCYTSNYDDNQWFNEHVLVFSVLPSAVKHKSVIVLKDIFVKPNSYSSPSTPNPANIA